MLNNDHEHGTFPLMNALELKIPPPVVALLLGGAMWAVSRVTPAAAAHGMPGTALAVAVAVTGIGFALAGEIEFRRAKTTPNPLKPQNVSSLVTTGIYRLTRNPMYVGGCLVLLAWAIFLLNPWALPGPALYVAYITRFQIRPEEKVLRSRFGEAYAMYASGVRRWL